MVDIDIAVKTAKTGVREAGHIADEVTSDGSHDDTSEQMLRDLDHAVRTTCYIGKQAASGWGSHASDHQKNIDEEVTI